MQNKGKKEPLVKANFIFITLLSRVVIKSPLPIARIRGSQFCLYNTAWLYWYYISLTKKDLGTVAK